MSWLYSRALVEAYSQVGCSDGAPSAQSSETPTPQAYLWRDKTMEAWNRFPSGMTFEPLTDVRGEALLTSFLEASRAKTSQARERASASMASEAAFGSKCSESFARFDHDSSSWRTPQCSPVADSIECSQVWPRWGTMRSGECWEGSTSAPPQKANAFGSLPRPTASMARRGWGFTRHHLERADTRRNSKETMANALRLSFGHYQPSVATVEWIMGWPIGWTALEPLETGKFRQWLDLHGVSYRA